VRKPGWQAAIEPGGSHDHFSREGGLLIVGLPLLGAVVELSDHVVEEVPLGGGMPVALFASAPVVAVGPR